METVFTPLQSAFGGVLIGTASVVLMSTLGRIMGATGVLSGAMFATDRGDLMWRLAVLAGMLTGPFVYFLAAGSFPTIQVPAPIWLVAIGGFVVGIGVTLGGGCPSGHGVCGIARLSPRSVVATLTFMATAAVTVFILRHLLGVY